MSDDELNLNLVVEWLMFVIKNYPQEYYYLEDGDWEGACVLGNGNHERKAVLNEGKDKLQNWN